MKRKIIGIGMLLLFSVFCIGCKKESEKQDTELNVYYLDRNENHINAMPYESVAAMNEKEKLIRDNADHGHGGCAFHDRVRQERKRLRKSWKKMLHWLLDTQSNYIRK